MLSTEAAEDGESERSGFGTYWEERIIMREINRALETTTRIKHQKHVETETQALRCRVSCPQVLNH